MPDNTTEELEVFKLFAEHCSMKITLDSIEKRQPPEPDILCLTDEGTNVFFELVRIVDPTLAKGVSTQVKLQRDLEAKSNYETFQRKYENACIALHFKKDLSKQARCNAIPAIISVLEELSGGFEGVVDLNAKGLSSYLERCDISRGDFVGPSFYVACVTSVADYTLNTISDKLKRSYTVSGPLHLLAYFDLHVMDAGTEWAPDLLEEIRLRLSNSTFEGVWLFHTVTREIRWVSKN